MSSIWAEWRSGLRGVGAVIRKEWRSESRAQTGLLTAGLFSVVSVFCLAVASYNQELLGRMAAGLIWVSLLFSALLTVPRRFLSEEEQGTGDLLRLTAPTTWVYYGKVWFSLAEQAVVATVVSGLFFLLTSARLVEPGLYALGLVGSILAITAATSLCGAIASTASNRASLAATIALPLLAPIIFFGVAAVAASMGDGRIDDGYRAAGGLLGYGIGSIAVGSFLFSAIWKP